MDDLPVELVELVVELVNFRDICALRLCSRDLHAKASQGRFRSFVHDDKRLPLTEDDLRTLVSVTGPGGLGGGLERLVLVGVCDAYDPRGERTTLGAKQTHLLRKAFHNIAVNSQAGKLGSLSLEVAVRLDGKDFPPTDAIGYNHMMMPGRITGEGYPKGRAVKAYAVWKASSQTFETAMEALSRSELVVDELEIFTDVLHCSLACDRLVRASGGEALWPVFRRTRKLALSVSHNFEIRDPRHSAPNDEHQGPKPGSENVDPDSAATGEHNVQNIVRFLAAFPKLDELEIQWYTIQKSDSSAGPLVEQNFLQQVNAAIRWPSLRSCTIKGVHTKTEPLLAFFKRHSRLTYISFEGIHFPPAKEFLVKRKRKSKAKPKKRTWQLQPLLNYFSRKASKLEYLRLRDMRESRRLMFRPSGDGDGVLRGEQARQRVVCSFVPITGRPPPAQIEDIWERADEHRRYGPP